MSQFSLFGDTEEEKKPQSYRTKRGKKQSTVRPAETPRPVRRVDKSMGSPGSIIIDKN